MSKRINVKLDALKITRTRASEDSPYLASALWNVIPVERPGLKTMAVDKHWRLYYDPELEKQWTPQEMAAVCEHEIWHLLRGHHTRAETKGVSQVNASAWNCCADAEINDDMKAEGKALPKGAVFPSSMGFPDGKMAEEYYDLLPRGESPDGQGDKPKDGDSKKKGKGKGPDTDKLDKDNPMKSGSGSDGLQKPWEEPSEIDGGKPEVKPLEQELIKRDVATKILEHAKARGTMASGMARWAEEVLRPKVDWRRELRASVRHAIEDKVGDQDYSYCKPSRRQLPDIILPSMRDPVVVPALVVDTSGSISDDYLKQFLGEVQGCIKSCGLDQVPVIFCDAQTYGVQKVNKASKLRAQGGGGTDMGVGIMEAEKLRPRPNIIIVLTDGYTPWPQECPKGVKVIVGTLYQAGCECPPGPTWARNIKIEIADESGDN